MLPMCGPVSAIDVVKSGHHGPPVRDRTPRIGAGHRADELKGQVPVGLLVLKADVHRPEEHIVREAVQLVRDRIGPVASFKTAVIVGRLPKTRSGKILRGTMRRIADDHQYSVPPTIDDPKILEEITEALHRVGYGRAFANVEPSS
jgi:propionyl-CoA synthetase